MQAIVENYSPDISEFLSHRTKSEHKDFLWSGPELQVLPRTEDLCSFINVVEQGERLDLPSCPIYVESVDDGSPGPTAPGGKRPLPEDSMDVVEEQSKRRRS
jgi:hypothetical protein